MKALFVGLPLHGHTNPSLPLVRALCERGDTCAYFTTPAFRERVEQTGAQFRPYRNAFLSDLSQLPGKTDELSWLLMRTTGEVLADEMAAFRTERPDYVITDSVAPWGQWIGELLGVPVVTSITTFAINRHVLAFAVAGGSRPKGRAQFFSKLRHMTTAMRLGRRLRREYGVRGTGIMKLAFGSSALNIVYTSRLFQPRAETFDESYRFIGPSTGPRARDGGADWGSHGTAPIVYVSLGTLFNADSGFYRMCFDAFRDEAFSVAMSVGDSIAVDSLGPHPANFSIYRHVPQLAVLAQASAFVTHGGMNSVGESLLNGVPMVVVPQMSEQELVGRQVESVGAGLRLVKEVVTPEQLRSAVRRVLEDASFRESAARLRRSFGEAGGPAAGADAIVAFTRGNESLRRESA